MRNLIGNFYVQIERSETIPAYVIKVEQETIKRK